MSNPLVSHFSEHLQELRKRTLISFLAVIIFTAVAYFFSESITRFLMEPLFKAHPALRKLVYTNLTEAFISYIKVSLFVGLIAGFPVVLYETWMFVAPGLHKNEKFTALKVVLGETYHDCAGVDISKIIVLPEALT